MPDVTTLRAEPRALQLWWGLWIACAATVAALRWESAAVFPHAPAVPVAGLLCLVGVVASNASADWVAERRLAFSANSVAHAAAAALLPVPWILCVAAAGPGTNVIRRRGPLYRTVYTVAGDILVMLATRTALTAILEPAGRPSLEPGRVIAAVTTAVVAYAVVDTVALVVAFRLARRAPVRVMLHRAVVLFEPTAAQVTLGLFMAALWSWAPPSVVLLLPLTAAAYREVAFHTVERASRSDTKTGLSNARHFRRVAERQLRRARGRQRPVALLLCDIDYLRRVNNKYGHLAGDAAIASVAAALRASVRDGDLAARFGGEEFALLLPGSTLEQAASVAERIRRTLAALPVVAPGVPDGHVVTVSAGVGVALPGEDLDTVVARVDEALYAAKHSGRNRVCLAGTVPLQARQQPKGGRLPARTG